MICQSPSELLTVSASGTQRWLSGYLTNPISGYKTDGSERWMIGQPFVLLGTIKVSA
jgi:hypothetical protein